MQTCRGIISDEYRFCLIASTTGSVSGVPRRRVCGIHHTSHQPGVRVWGDILGCPFTVRVPQGHRDSRTIRSGGSSTSDCRSWTPTPCPISIGQRAPHSASFFRACLAAVDTLPWPAALPGLSPIENVGMLRSVRTGPHPYPLIARTARSVCRLFNMD